MCKFMMFWRRGERLWSEHLISIVKILMNSGVKCVWILLDRYEFIFLCPCDFVLSRCPLLLFIPILHHDVFMSMQRLLLPLLHDSQHHFMLRIRCVCFRSFCL